MRSTPMYPEHDVVLDALDEVVQVLTANVERLHHALEQAVVVRGLRLAGQTYQEILEQCDRPLIVELLTINLTALQRTGHRLREAQACALRVEGVTMDRIAELFGVSRQRISALLRAAPP